MSTFNIYLTFNGNCEAVFNFYKSVFGGEFAYVSRFKELPKHTDYEISKKVDEKIMHISLPISKGSILMGCDSSDPDGKTITLGNNFSISVNADSIQETTRIFNSLAKNGVVKMPLDKTFWGSFFGELTDQFGINWMISCELKPIETIK